MDSDLEPNQPVPGLRLAMWVGLGMLLLAACGVTRYSRCGWR
jgi:hypothetical protein